MKQSDFSLYENKLILYEEYFVRRGMERYRTRCGFIQDGKLYRFTQFDGKRILSSVNEEVTDVKDVRYIRRYRADMNSKSLGKYARTTKKDSFD
jgi:hypothetical protein